MNTLIIKLGALGDVVMATPLIAAIQDAHPDDELHLLTATPFDRIFTAWSRLRITTRPRHGFFDLLRTAAWVRQQKFDRIYDLQGNDRSGFLCAIAGSPMRVGNHTRFPYTHHPRSTWSGQCHIFERMTEVLQAAGVQDIEAHALLPAGEPEHRAVARWLATHGLGTGEFAIIHASASAARPEKVWPHFDALARRLKTKSLCPVWIGSDDDRLENQRLCRVAGGIDATGEFTIPALAELGRQARFAVTNDSGPMHVLSASNIPVFGLFGPSDWRRNHALGQRDQVIACVECLPEFRGRRTGNCLGQLSCELVWERLELAGLVPDASGADQPLV